MSPGKESGRKTNVRFGILGTGVVGKTIASRLDDMEHEVMVGTRDPEEPASRAEPGTYGNPHSASRKRNTPGSSSPRSAYLRSLAVLSEFEGDTERAIEHLREAHTLARKIGVPGELWQIQSRLRDLHERRGEETEAQKAYSLAAQTLRTLAVKIENEELRERFLSAPLVRRVLGQLGRRALL
jgi:hypothetical protein